MDSTQKLLAYFAHKHSKASVTALMKLCYLADLVALKAGHGRVTDFEYKRYTFGPFDQKIYPELEQLVKSGVLKMDVYYTAYGDDNEVVAYRYAKDDDFDIQLSDDQKRAADEVLQALGGFGPKALTDVAYKTKPMTSIGATLGGVEHMGEELNLNAS